VSVVSARAALTQGVLAEVARLPQAKSIVAAAGEELVERISHLLPIAWVPFDEHIRIVGALHDALGPEPYRQFWRRVMVQTLGAPLVAGLVRMSTAGHGPMRLLSRGQMLHGALTRGTGTLDVESSTDSTCVVTLKGFPSSLHPLTKYAEGISGSILGACDRAEVRAAVTMRVVSEPRGDVVYDVSWR
jgi:hypothetical protein